MPMLRNAALALSALLFVGGGAGSAHAACYETIGCTGGDLYRERDLMRMSCEILDDVRNTIYAENGYCFRKLVNRRRFGRRHCRYANAGAVPLNGVERANVAAIQRAERTNRCPTD